MGMNFAVVDDFRAKAEAVPENFKYVDPDDVEVRTRRPIWTWVARAAHEVPIGKCILLPVPEGYGVERFMMNMRSSLAMSKETRYDKFSIRRSKHEDYVVLMKSGEWERLYQRMERAEREAATA